jgi:hypothetical protein
LHMRLHKQPCLRWIAVKQRIGDQQMVTHVT